MTPTKTKTAHTPGPWTVVTHKSGIKVNESGVRDESEAYTSAFAIEAPGKQEFVVGTGLKKCPNSCLVIEPKMAKFCDPEGVYYTPEECNANAALIASAPELLAMVERLQWTQEPTGLGVCAVCRECHAEEREGHAKDCEIGRLILKAKGEQ